MKQTRYRSFSTVFLLFPTVMMFFSFFLETAFPNSAPQVTILSPAARGQLTKPVKSMPGEVNKEISGFLQKHFLPVVQSLMGADSKTKFNAVTTLGGKPGDWDTLINRLEIVSETKIPGKDGKPVSMSLYIYFYINESRPDILKQSAADLDALIKRTLDKEKKSVEHYKKQQEIYRKNKKELYVYRPGILSVGPYTALPDRNGWTWMTPDAGLKIILRTLDSSVSRDYMNAKAQALHSLLANAGLYGFKSTLLATPSAGLSEEAAEARANQLMEVIRKWEQKNGLKVIYSSLAGAAAVANYIKLEEGSQAPLRTTHEVEFYNRLKKYAEIRKEGMVLNMGDLLYVGLDSIPRNRDKTVNLFLAVLTIHNVTRIIARPEQWMEELIGNPRYPGVYGHPETDSVMPVLKDLLGMKPTFGKTMPELFMEPFKLKWMPDRSRVYDGNWTVLLYGPGGLFQIQPGTEIAGTEWDRKHWNGGCHYYYWVGFLGRMSVGSIGVWYGSLGEQDAKNLTATESRGKIQISYFKGGAQFAEKFIQRQQAETLGDLLDAAGP